MKISYFSRRFFRSKGLLLLGVILVWEGLFRLELFSPLVFPSPWDVAVRMAEDLLSGKLLRGGAFSLLIILAAFIPSLTVGFLMAFLSIRSSFVEGLTEKLSAIAHPLPGIALLPLLIIWTGLGVHILILIVAHSVLWPFYVNVRSGFRSIPQLWIDVGRNNGFSRRREFLSILLPGSFPSIVSGLKIGWARAWRGVISAEMIFGTIGNAGGLGWFIYNKRIFMDTPGMIGGLIFLMALGLAVENLVFGRLEDAIRRRWGGDYVHA